MVAAWRRGGGIDTVFVPVFMALGAFPAYFTGLLVVYFLGLKLGWFPIQHAYDNDATPGANWHFISSAFRHGVLPALVIVLAYAGGWVLNMRTVMINTISEDYVSMAHAKGLRDRRVMTRYAARNAILPPLNGFAAQFATAVGGVIFIELVFSYPGAGYTLQQAALGNDYPLTQALLLVFALCPIVANFVMDLLNLVLDPRVSERPDGADAADRSSCRPRRRSCARGAARVPGWLVAPARQPEGARSGSGSSSGWCCSACSRRCSCPRARRPSSRSSTRGRPRRSITSSARPTRAPTSSRRSRWGARRSLLLGAARRR